MFQISGDIWLGSTVKSTGLLVCDLRLAELLRVWTVTDSKGLIKQKLLVVSIFFETSADIILSSSLHDLIFEATLIFSIFFLSLPMFKKSHDPLYPLNLWPYETLPLIFEEYQRGILSEADGKRNLSPFSFLYKSCFKGELTPVSHGKGLEALLQVARIILCHNQP